MDAKKVDGSDRLTQKQETFCQRYFETGHAGESARFANYSPKTAYVIAAENLLKPKIQNRLRELNQLAVDASVMGKLERKQRLSEISRARLTDFIEAGADGAWINVGLESLNSAGLQSVKSRTEYDKDGAHPSVITDIKLHDPVKAIVALNDMDDIGVPKNNINIITKEVIINARETLNSNIARLSARINEAGSPGEPE